MLQLLSTNAWVGVDKNPLQRLYANREHPGQHFASAQFGLNLLCLYKGIVDTNLINMINGSRLLKKNVDASQRTTHNARRTLQFSVWMHLLCVKSPLHYNVINQEISYRPSHKHEVCSIGPRPMIKGQYSSQRTCNWADTKFLDL